MRLILVAPCLALSLAAQVGCTSADQPGAFSPRPGVASFQARSAPSIDDTARSALIAADRMMTRLEALHDRSSDVVTREALTWELDRLQKRSDVLLDDMTSGNFFARDTRVQNDVAELDLEVDQGVSAEAWALRAPVLEPREGNAETMPGSR